MHQREVAIAVIFGVLPDAASHDIGAEGTEGVICKGPGGVSYVYEKYLLEDQDQSLP